MGQSTKGMIDQAIHVHQRITKILEKLTNDVEAELEIRIQSLNHAFRDASNSVETLEPQVDRLKSKIDAVGGFMGETLLKTAQVSTVCGATGILLTAWRNRAKASELGLKMRKTSGRCSCCCLKPLWMALLSFLRRMRLPYRLRRQELIRRWTQL